MSALVGVQLLIGWFIMRALEELSQREVRATEILEAAFGADGEPLGKSSLFEVPNTATLHQFPGSARDGEASKGSSPATRSAQALVHF